MRKATNKFKCPVKIWNKFSDVGKKFYNEYFESFKFVVDADYNSEKLSKEICEIIAHNLSCIAVWILEEKLFTK